MTETMLDAYYKFREVRYFGSLDGLRALSILGVVGLGHPRLALPLTVGPTVLVAFLSYRYFETPFLAQKARCSHQPRAAVPSPDLAPVREEVAVVSTNS